MNDDFAKFIFSLLSHLFLKVDTFEEFCKIDKQVSNHLLKPKIAFKIF